MAVSAVVLMSTIGLGVFFIYKYNEPDIEPWEKGEMITVTVDTSSSPFADKAGDRITGIDADILRAVFLNMGLTEGGDFKFETGEYNDIASDLKKGNCTVGAGGFSESPRTLKKLAFTEWYAQDSLCVITLKDNPANVTLANLKSKDIGVVTDSAGDYFASTLYDSKKDYDPVLSDSLENAVEKLSDGKSNCIITDTLTARRLVLSTAGTDAPLEIRNEIVLPYGKVYFGFTLNLENTALDMKISSVLRDMKASATQNAAQDVFDYYLAHINDASIASFWDSHNIEDYRL